MRDYRAQTQALGALFNPVLDEPLPENLRALSSPPRVTPVKRPRRSPLDRWSLQRIAAGFMIALVSGAAGWLAHSQYPVSYTHLDVYKRQK